MRCFFIAALLSFAVAGCSSEPVAESVDATTPSWAIQAKKDAERDERRRELALKKKQQAERDAVRFAKGETDRIEAEKALNFSKQGRKQTTGDQQFAKARPASPPVKIDNHLDSAAKSLAISLNDPEWYVGGNLHNKTGREWVRASRKNKLATASDWITGSIEKKMQNSKRQREYRAERAKGKAAWLKWLLIQSHCVVAGLDAFYESKITQSQQNSLAVTLLMVELGWVDM